MVEDTTWNDESREDLRESIRNLVVGEVRLANSDRDEILQACREIYIEEECPVTEQDLFVRFAAGELDRASATHAAEKMTWPPDTDCDRLDRVESDLRDRGILLWQVSPCCDTCTRGELSERIHEIDARHPGFRDHVRGYAFFIDQNMAAMLAESRQLSVYLAYGWIARDDETVAPDVYENNALRIGHEVCASLREQGFEPDWDGDLSRKIGITLNWQRRTLLV